MKEHIHTDSQLKWIRLSLFNLLVLSLAGLLLRAFPILPVPYLSYSNVLHAHSHFAFGGWVLPALVFLVLRYFPEISARIPRWHWKNIIILIMASSYGMLISFALQGYGPVSITFSALSLFAAIYFGTEVLRHSRGENSSPTLFLKTGIIFCFISSLAPLALGPINSIGKTGSQLYYNIVYFYLHFQYNGFFTFFVLAALYKMIGRENSPLHGRKVYYLMTAACIPAYCLSVLWISPSVFFNCAGKRLCNSC